MTAIRLTSVGLVSALILPLPVAAQVPSMSALEREISEGPAAAAVATPSSELQKALAAKNYERAEQLLADAIARQPGSQSLLTQIASVFMLDRKPLNAAIALKKAEALGPLDNTTRLQLALAYIAMKRGARSSNGSPRTSPRTSSTCTGWRVWITTPVSMLPRSSGFSVSWRGSRP